MASATWLRHAVGRSPRSAAASSARARQAAVALAGARIVFQPIVSVATGSLVAVEALTRFARNAGSGPEKVFAQAHEAGFGPELEALCVRSALTRRDSLPPGTLISVNLSPDGLRSLAFAPFWPADLTGVIIEMTEQDPEDPAEVVAGLTALRERGAAIAVDDVGSGYAGLLRVADLRPDYVKVDRNIVSGLADSVARTAVLESLVTFSHRLGATVIGEGVADLSDLSALAQLDVDYAQGYAIGRPTWPPEAVTGAVSEEVVRACREAREAVLNGRSAPSFAATRTRDVYAVTAALSSAGDRSAVGAAIANAADELGVDSIGVSIIGTDDTLREIAAANQRVDATPYPLADYPATVAALRSGRALEVQVDDPTGDAAEKEVLRSFGEASLLLVPVLVGADPIGAVEVVNQTPRRWNAADIAYAQGLASHLGPVLKRMGVAQD
jgi:EAL domain-containing protein (putative c-di-GMP-specific phosphodiesterase class I)